MLKGEKVQRASDIYTERFNPYIRPDIKISIRKEGKTSQIWSIDFQNFIDRKNVFIDVYDDIDEDVEIIKQRGFFPDIRWQMTF